MPDLVAREARITLGQLPAELRDAVKRIRIFGPRELAQQLADEMELRFEPMGLNVEIVAAYAPDEFGVQLPPEAPVSPAFSLAARLLVGQPPVFEFLPPKPTLRSNSSSPNIRPAGCGRPARWPPASWRLSADCFCSRKFNSSCCARSGRRMSAKVQELDGLQQEIRQYRPWFDDTFRSLAILRQLTLAFPEDGAVTAKTMEIRDGNTVTCSGTAQDNARAAADVEPVAHGGRRERI